MIRSSIIDRARRDACQGVQPPRNAASLDPPHARFNGTCEKRPIPLPMIDDQTSLVVIDGSDEIAVWRVIDVTNGSYCRTDPTNMRQGLDHGAA
jgi:hypothetical protein